jgi:flagellar biosynthesis/type III secretory pathway M-ring protein FliF/YscJ
MKRILLSVIFLLVWMQLSSEAVMKFETLEHDFGRIKEESGPYKVDFKFTNSGDAPFQLIKVKAG